jgi:hypothetical protein
VKLEQDFGATFSGVLIDNATSLLLLLLRLQVPCCARGGCEA